MKDIRQIVNYVFLAAIVVLPAGMAAQYYTPATDVQQVPNDLSTIEENVISYIDANGVRPSNLGSLSLGANMNARAELYDYTYSNVGTDQYQLCANFPYVGLPGKMGPQDGPIHLFYTHGKGRTCFVGTSVVLKSKSQIAAGVPICSTDGESFNNVVKRIDYATITAVNTTTVGRPPQTVRTLSTIEHPGTYSVCEASFYLDLNHAVKQIQAIPPGTPVELSINVSSQVLEVQALDMAQVPAGLRVCFGTNHSLQDPVGFNEQMPLKFVSWDQDGHWIKFVSPDGTTQEVYWCDSINVMTSSTPGAPGYGFTQSPSALKPGETFYLDIK